MTDLGLSTLTDDQLVELARALAAELADRNPGVVDAAKAAVAAATARRTLDQANQWAMKKWIGTMIETGMGTGWQVNVWLSSGRDDVRVYLENPRRLIKACLHITGNSKNPPGSLAVDLPRVKRREAPVQFDKVMAGLVMQHTYATWPDGVRIDCSQAAATSYDIPPMPEDVAARVEAIRLHADWAQQRDALDKQLQKDGKTDYWDRAPILGAWDTENPEPKL